MRYHEDGCDVYPLDYAEGVRTVWILEGTDPSKYNAQAARCTGGDMVNGWDRISSAP